MYASKSFKSTIMLPRKHFGELDMEAGFHRMAARAMMQNLKWLELLK